MLNYSKGFHKKEERGRLACVFMVNHDILKYQR